MASELQLQEAIISELINLSYFDSKDVVINDWSILEHEAVTAPWVILFTADTFSSTQTTVTANDSYIIPGWLLVEMGARSWKESMDEFQEARQAIKDTFNDPSSNARTLGFDGVQLPRIYNLSEILYIYPVGVDPEFQPDATPEFIYQILGFSVEQF